MTTRELPVVGGTWNGGQILAVHLHGDPWYPDLAEGVVLTWEETARTYVVWTYDQDGEFSEDSPHFHSEAALSCYSNRVMARLFAHYNRMAPSLTYMAPNPERNNCP